MRINVGRSGYAGVTN